MKKAFQVILLFLYVLPLSVWSVTPSDKIEWIENQYKIILVSLNEYKKIEFDFIGESTEGAEGIGYLSDVGETKLIEVTYFGENGKSEFEFYYLNSHAVFIRETIYSYNANFLMTERKVKERLEEEGVLYEAFDSHKTKIEYWQYYFYMNEVVRITGPKGNVIDKAEGALQLSKTHFEKVNETLNSR